MPQINTSQIHTDQNWNKRILYFTSNAKLKPHINIDKSQPLRWHVKWNRINVRSETSYYELLIKLYISEIFI